MLRVITPNPCLLSPFLCLKDGQAKGFPPNAAMRRLGDKGAENRSAG